MPARVGGMFVSATTPATADTEAVAAASSARGDGLVVLTQVFGANASGACALADDVLLGLVERESLYNGVARAMKRLPASGAVRLALGIIAVSPTDGCVEVLNAGLPPIVCVRHDGSVTAFPSRSAPLVAHDATSHPYERVALAWNASWLVAAARPTGFDLQAALERARKLDLAGGGETLASLAPDALAHRVRAALSGDPAADALLVIGAVRRALDRGSSSV